MTLANHLTQWFSTEGDFATPPAPKHLTVTGDSFECHNWEVGDVWHLIGTSQGCSKYPQYTGQPLARKDYPVQNINFQVEKL